MRQLRQPYYANTLIDVQLPAQTVSTPAENRSGVVLFPLPSIKASGRLTSPNVMIDTGTWLVHDVLASTLPVRCPSQTAAQRLTDTWVDNIATGTVDPSNRKQVEGWCKWFVDAHPDCATFTAMAPPPAGDALTSTVVKALAEVTGPWPADEDQDDDKQEAVS